MTKLTRRDFLKSSIAAGAALALPGCMSLRPPFSRVIGANDDIRIAIVGFNGHGKSHIKGYSEIPGVRIVALCDPDQDVLDWGVKDFSSRNERVDTYTDIRKLLEDKNIDAISGATPNHWHSLSTVWACQAGKDVCVEKPVSHNIFEGRKMVEAARKYSRIVQADLDRRRSEARQLAIQYVQQGNLGRILRAHGFVYKRRKSMGKVAGPQQPPKSVDYDLWCGPAPKGPLMRQQFHYDWHWQWATGNGETGNNGPHNLDDLRWALGQPGLPTRVMSYGGRFGYDDDGETPNTQVVFFDYKPAPIIFEVRGLPRKQDDTLMDANRMTSSTGVPIQVGEDRASPNNSAVLICEHGYLVGSVVYDNDGKEIKRFSAEKGLARAHFPNGMRTRKLSDLRIDILEGHLSTSLCHMANISYRLGQEATPDEIKEMAQDDKGAQEAFERFQTHLEANGVDLSKTPAVLGPSLEMDPDTEKFVGGVNFQRANELLSRDYREPFVVPEVV